MYIGVVKDFHWLIKGLGIEVCYGCYTVGTAQQFFSTR